VNFQGFGRFLTASTGEDLFRIVKPVVYPGRVRHIHMAILQPGGKPLVTQVFVAGEPKARESGIVPFAPLPGSQIGELTARFDVVLCFTPPG